MLKQKNGITLVALVVTIIVLLILAAVSISMVTGENGIATKASKSSVLQDRTSILEKLQVEVLDENVDTEGEAFEISQYLFEKGYIDENNVVNTEKLLGKKLKTGNGTGKNDVYTVELEGDGYKLVYYESESKRIVIGKIGKTIYSFEYTQADIDETLKYLIFDESTGELSVNKEVVGEYYHTNVFPDKIVIPNEINGVKVTSLGNGASNKGIFAEVQNLKEVIILADLYQLSGFRSCTSLEKVYIAGKISWISYDAFSGCSSLEYIELPSSVTVIGSYAFSGCSSLEYIKIPNSVTTIEYAAFQSCSSLKNVELPSSVTKIGQNVFSGCSSLENVKIPSSVTTINSDAFYRCSSLKNIELPSSVTEIGNSAFEGCSSLENIKIPNSLTTIHFYAFKGCSSLKNIVIPSSVTTMGSNVFANCSGMEKIYCEVDSKPDGWEENWNSGITVSWSYVSE